MNLRSMCGVLLCVSLATVLLLAVPRAQAREGESLRLGGTFLQLTSTHLEWTESDWRELFDHFRVLGLSRIIVQWSAYEDTHFYSKAGENTGRRSPVETILDLADQAGMQVWLGLAVEEKYWTEIAGTPEVVGAYLQGLAQRSTATATELAPLAAGHAAFAGWYIPQEIDDASWRDRERRPLLYSFVADLSAALQRLTPNASVAVSGFSNAAMDPMAFQTFWEGLLKQAGAIDTVLFQDGIGARKLDLYELPLYTAAIRSAAESNSRHVVAIVELFHQVSGPPLDTEAFQAVPAPLERIIRQLEIARAYAPTAVAFSVPEYLSPKGGAAAATLYDEYIVACVTKACSGKAQ